MGYWRHLYNPIRRKRYNQMITNRLTKDANKADVLIEFSENKELPDPINQFLGACREENLTIRRSATPAHQVTYYYVSKRKDVRYEDISMKEVPTEFEHAMTVLYMNHLNEGERKKLPTRPAVRTLLLREDLDSMFSLQYQIENVESKTEALAFFCDMAAGFINRACCKEVEFFDQKVQSIVKIKKNQDNILKDTWLNILYQIPGLGKQKCIRIAEAFPTYQSIMSDYNGDQNLRDLEIARGNKSSKLGAVLAKRIYKVFLSTKFQDSVLD